MSQSRAVCFLGNGVPNVSSQNFLSQGKECNREKYDGKSHHCVKSTAEIAVHVAPTDTSDVLRLPE